MLTAGIIVRTWRSGDHAVDRERIEKVSVRRKLIVEGESRRDRYLGSHSRFGCRSINYIVRSWSRRREVEELCRCSGRMSGRWREESSLSSRSSCSLGCEHLSYSSCLWCVWKDDRRVDSWWEAHSCLGSKRCRWRGVVEVSLALIERMKSYGCLVIWL